MFDSFCNVTIYVFVLSF